MNALLLTHRFHRGKNIVFCNGQAVPLTATVFRSVLSLTGSHLEIRSPLCGLTCTRPVREDDRGSWQQTIRRLRSALATATGEELVEHVGGGSYQFVNIESLEATSDFEILREFFPDYATLIENIAKKLQTNTADTDRETLALLR